MPLTAGGKLTIVASSDLGALGSRDGSPITCEWVPGIAPLLLPWLVLLGLLALKPNRRAAAWLIWLPLGCAVGFTQAALPILPPEASFFLDVAAALAFGLAAVWLMTTYLRRSHRLLTFLCLLGTLTGFSALAALAKQGLNVELLQIGIVLAAGILASATALSLGGLICRGRYRPAGLCFWTLVLLAVIWLLIATPCFLIAVMASGESISWNEFFIPVLGIVTGNFALLLPFLILSSANPFYREHLKALLHLRSEAPPLLSAPAPETILKM